MNKKSFEALVRANPKSNFVVFTHQDKPFWHPDYLIRKFLALRYGVPIADTFSHCGTVWLEDNKLVYWHQTYPTFTKDIFNPRKYNVIYKINESYTVEYARITCESLHRVKKPYGIGTLLTFAFTIWWTWFSNPINAGKVCSEAVAYSYPTICRGNPIDVDPQKAELFFREYLPKLSQYIIDNR